MRIKTKKRAVAMLFVLVLAMLSAALLVVPSAGAERESFTYADDPALSNTVWEVKEGAISEGEYAGEKSLVFTGGDTSYGLGTTFATVSTLEEFREFDLYLDMTYYEVNGNSLGSGIRISFGNAEMNLPSARAMNYMPAVITGGAPALWNTKTETQYLPTGVYNPNGPNNEYFWSWSNFVDQSRVAHMKLSVRDEGIFLYDDYNAQIGEYCTVNTWRPTFPLPLYVYEKQDGDDYTAEYGKISIGIDVYTTKTLALSRMDVIPYEEDADGAKVEYKDPAFASVSDGKKDYETDGNTESALFTAENVSVGAEGVSLVNADGTYGYIESANEYKNFDLILHLGDVVSEDGALKNDFMIDFGNGMTFTAYSSTSQLTAALPPLKKGGAAVTTGSDTHVYFVAPVFEQGEEPVIRLRVQNGTLTYYDRNGGTACFGSEASAAWNNEAVKDVIITHGDLLDAGKIKIYPQENGAPLNIRSAEIVNLDKDSGAAASADHEPYTVYDTEALVLNFEEEQTVEAVKFAGGFLSEADYSTEGKTLKIAAEIVDKAFEETGEKAYECVVYTARGALAFTIAVTVPPDVKITYMAGDGETVLHEDIVAFYEFIEPYDSDSADFYAWYDENGKKVDFKNLRATANVTYYEGKTTDSHAVEFFYRNNLGEEKSITLQIPCGTTMTEALELLDEESDYNAVYGSMGYELLNWNFAGDHVFDQAETVVGTYAELTNSQSLFVDFEDGSFFDPLDWYLSSLNASRGDGEIVWQFSGYMDNVSTQQIYKDFEFSFDISKLTDVFCEEYLFSVEFAIPEDMRGGLVGSRGIVVHFIISDQTGSLYSYVVSHDVLLSSTVVIPEFADLSTAEVREHSFPAGDGSNKTQEFKFISMLQEGAMRIHVRYQGGQLLLGYSENGGATVFADAINLPSEYAGLKGLVSLGRNDPRLNDGTIAFDNIRLDNLTARDSELIVLAKDKTANADGSYDYVVGRDQIPALSISFRGQSLLGIKYAVGIGGEYDDLQSADIILEDYSTVTDTVSLDIEFIAGLIAANQKAFDDGEMSLKFRIVTDTDWEEIIFKLSGVPFAVNVYDGETVIGTFEDLSCGDTIELPAPPEKTGYDFVGYRNKLTGNIETERQISAVLKADYELVYKIKTFTVRFFDKEGKLLKTVRDVEYGSNITDGAPVKEDGTAYAWNAAFDNVTGDLEIYEEGYGEDGCNGSLGVSGWGLALVCLSAAAFLAVRRGKYDR